MTEYILFNRFGYNKSTDEILIGGLGCKYLSESERDIYLSDTLTHEIIHKILFKLFNTTISSLFDIIGDSLRNIKILKYVFEHNFGMRTWSESIKNEGIQYFYYKHVVTTYSHDKANILCNRRCKE